MTEPRSEYLEVLSWQQEREPSASLHRFIGELARQAKRPPGGDRVIGAMCTAASCILERVPPFRHAVEDLLLMRAAESPSNQVGDFRAVAQTEALSDYPDFPLTPSMKHPLPGSNFSSSLASDMWRQVFHLWKRNGAASD